MDEHWLPIVGYEGLYEVSDTGAVRSTPRMRPHRWGGLRFDAGKSLMLIRDADGYSRVNLWRDGAAKQFQVHRLVLSAFKGPCPDGMQSLHGDGSRGNNVLSNLRWGTPKENMSERDIAGNGPQGIRNPRAKISPAQVLEIRADVRVQRLIAVEFGLDNTTVSNIKRRKTWATV